MSRRTGSADLPLHGGRVPEWLSARMARLGRVIVEAIVLHYGRDEVLRRLAHPFWFQSFGAVMGMDWHSSGITTSVLAALKRGLREVRFELGLHVCGGRGQASRQTPAELLAVGERTGQDGAALAHTSRLVAKIDSAAVQDGFGLYLHGFIVSDAGDWVVVQQGMNAATRTARRYHWLSSAISNFVEAPHSAIEGAPGGLVLNLTDARAARARAAALALVRDEPTTLIDTLARLRPSAAPDVNLVLPAHHEVRPEDVDLRRLRATVLAAHERGPRDFADLLMTPGLGARTVRALAHVAEVVHGAPSCFADPARFSLALGGKDGHPCPVPVRVYDETLRVLRDALSRSQLGDDERMGALRTLDAHARRIERAMPSGEGTVDVLRAVVGHDLQNRTLFGGRTVFDAPPAPRTRPQATPATPLPKALRSTPRPRPTGQLPLL